MVKIWTEKETRLEDQGPVIKIKNDEGKKVFVFNPYYRGKDPMKEIFWRVKTDSGMWGFVRNPFAQPSKDNPDQTTAEKIINSSLNRGNIDPVLK